MFIWNMLFNTFSVILVIIFIKRIIFSSNMILSAPGQINHLAVVMDGNRRWAKQNKLKTILGHQKGGDAVTDAISVCLKNKIKTMVVYDAIDESAAGATRCKLLLQSHGRVSLPRRSLFHPARSCVTPGVDKGGVNSSLQLWVEAHTDHHAAHRAVSPLTVPDGFHRMLEDVFLPCRCQQLGGKLPQRSLSHPLVMRGQCVASITLSAVRSSISKYLIIFTYLWVVASTCNLSCHCI